MPLFSHLYAGSKAPASGQPLIWHLSYNQSTNPNRRALCGKQTAVDDERLVFTREELRKLIDPSVSGLFPKPLSKLCAMCDKASPWPTIAPS